MSQNNNATNTRRGKRKRILHKLGGLLSRNPVLVSGMALAPVVVAATSLKTAVALAVALLVSTLPTLLLARVFGKRIPPWLRLPVYAITAALLLVPAVYLVNPIAPTVFDSMGMYFGLMAVNTILFARAETFALRHSLGSVLLDGLCYCGGFLLAAVLVGGIRELLASNTLWGLPVTLPLKISAASLPFAGFLAAGMVAGAGRFVRELWLRLASRRGTQASSSKEASL